MDATADRERLRDCIEDLVYQFAYRSDGPCLTTGGLSVLVEAFEVLGWTDPHEVPELLCSEPGCTEAATCGTPTTDGYKRTCGRHIPREAK